MLSSPRNTHRVIADAVLGLAIDHKSDSSHEVDASHRESGEAAGRLEG